MDHEELQELCGVLLESYLQAIRVTGNMPMLVYSVETVLHNGRRSGGGVAMVKSLRSVIEEITKRDLNLPEEGEPRTKELITPCLEALKEFGAFKDTEAVIFVYGGVSSMNGRYGVAVSWDSRAGTSSLFIESDGRVDEYGSVKDVVWGDDSLLIMQDDKRSPIRNLIEKTEA